ncbi:MAG: hypothetical protein JST09_01460 [Bacteroidetes bacterium]|nr:hypothetical protein [Bacteroidota bacterium]
MEASYSFAIHSRFSPDNDSISVGDTIYLISSTSKKLTDVYSGNQIEYNGADNLGSTLSIGELRINSTIPTDAVFDFEYFSENGRIYNDRSVSSPDGVQQITYQETETEYKIKIGIIPKKKGIYAMGLGDGLSIKRKGAFGCQRASFAISITDTEQHFYYYQNWRPGYTLTETDMKRLYCFKVN